MEKLDILYSEIKEIRTTKSLNNVANDFCKLAEEVGELSQSINKTLGIKSHKLSEEQIKLEVIEESADVLQNLLSICAHYNITLTELLNMLKQKNTKWKNI